MKVVVAFSHQPSAISDALPDGEHAFEGDLGVLGGFVVDGYLVDYAPFGELVEGPGEMWWMRYIVAHGQTTGSRQKIVLSGFSRARRETRLISVPTAQAVRRGPSVIVRVIGRAVHVGGGGLHGALGVDDDRNIGVFRAGLLDLLDGEAAVD